MANPVRGVARDKQMDAIEMRNRTMALSSPLPPPFNQNLTVDEANEIANALTDGAMSVVASNGKMELRGAAAGAGVPLFPFLTTRIGIAATVMEYYR
ncbi:MAG: hypothetical protein C0483_11265 [Pirellula sp.]|nr:hypothetical protein [Pirellula sp.]